MLCDDNVREPVAVYIRDTSPLGEPLDTRWNQHSSIAAGDREGDDSVAPTNEPPANECATIYFAQRGGGNAALQKEKLRCGGCRSQPQETEPSFHGQKLLRPINQ
jgi:hypothetical protein